MTIIFLGGCINDTKNETTISSSSSSIFRKKIFKNDKYFKDIINKDIDPRVINEISFKLSYENTELNNLIFLVESIKIANVENFRDINRNNYKTLISVKYKFLNKYNKLKNIKPSNGYIILKDKKNKIRNLFRRKNR